ncbi:Transposon Ty3-G Gag-Pol polyprotein [Labeo rohita]|uniref:Transposon Ty3-G Gag-Pol polyprotein n=1 Tax=Labeo rohita TaxID=84645 RepID=A0ABQ8MSD1_LABRO|nr:Transposon Ty3-G Gag-Pol polyprotein [Labeo rohita]
MYLTCPLFVAPFVIVLLRSIRQAELDLQLEVRRLEIEADKEVQLCRLELEAAKVAASSAVQPSPAEAEIDSYFGAFERIATALQWPKEVWPLMLQCKLVGKAQEVCSTLSLEESLQYETIKSAVLRAYELVPKAYRQRFRNHKKSIKVSSVSQAAVLADEFVLTHKNVFVSSRTEKHSAGLPSQMQLSRPKPSTQAVKTEHVCFYCHKQGHLIAECLALKRKQQQQPKGVGFVSSVYVERDEDRGGSFAPFLMKGLISVMCERQDQKKVQILRDTDAAQSFVISGALLLSEKSYCGAIVLVQGFEMGVVSVPLHLMHLQCDLDTGFVKVGVCPSLPVRGVILGNDLAGGKVMPILEVLDKPAVSSAPDILTESYPEVFSACAVTRAQLRSAGDETVLADSFMAPVFAGQIFSPPFLRYSQKPSQVQRPWVHSYPVCHLTQML